MNRRVFRLLIALVTAAVVCGMARGDDKVQGFVHPGADINGYVWPQDRAVLDKLDRWQDLKFGVLFHYGLYSLPGIVESWSVCSEDVDWIRRGKPLPYDEYKRWYYSLADSLAPVNFDPGKWADIMKDAGMKYMLFTTKHHDGFCLYDTRLSDFSIMSGPHPVDMTRGVLDAFRSHGFMAGCYFSKPDWHSQWYWNPAYATPDRRENYKRERHPEWWRNYCEYTAGQIGELLSGRYGDIDILWLDGGWVSGDEIGLDSILTVARSGRQPGLICVDRSIRGRNENYQTPERGIPETQLPYPWESCIPLSNDWGWVPNAPYKPASKVISLLMETVAKGGNLLLGVGPTAEGTIEAREEKVLHEIGEWLKRYGEAIYSTRAIPLYNDGAIWFTGSKDGKTVYALVPYNEGENFPATLTWQGNIPRGAVRLVSNGAKLKHRISGDTVTVTLPKNLPHEPIALKFSI